MFIKTAKGPPMTGAALGGRGGAGAATMAGSVGAGGARGAGAAVFYKNCLHFHLFK